MNEPKSLDEIRQEARNENSNNIYLPIVHLCDYIEKLELLLNNKPVVNPAKDIKKKGTQNG
jgi:hypothetical protein